MKVIAATLASVAGLAAFLVSGVAAVPARAEGAPGRAGVGHVAPPVGPTAVAPLAGDGNVDHDGRWLTDAQGRVLMLHGLNLVAKGMKTPSQEGFGDADATWMAQNGFDVVRLGLTAAALMPSPGAIDQSYLNSFAQTVSDLTSHGLLVLVDLHQDTWGPSLDNGDGFPAWMTYTNGATDNGQGWPLGYATNPAIQAAFDSLWNDTAGPGGTGLQEQVAAMFHALAGAVGSNPGVIGYDLLNEPWPGSNWAECLFVAAGCPARDHSGLDVYNTKMAGAIRSADPTHLLFGEPYVLFNFGDSRSSVAVPGGDANGGLAFHMYTLDAAHEPDVISNAIAWSSQTSGALLAGEFGVNGGSTNDPAGVAREADEFDGAMVPWIWWSYDGGMVPDLGQPPGGSNLDAPIADALVRAHPVAVAGTPLGLSVSSGVMTFRYSTTGPGGTVYPSGTATLFNVPARPYPNGWSAVVQGGTVTSTSPLTVVANTGAATVTVNVVPGGTAPGAVDSAYDLATRDGGVFSYASYTPPGYFFGSAPGASPTPVVAIASAPSGNGYWLVTSSGTVTGFGDAASFGSLAAPPAASIVGIAPTPDGEGYWLAGADGGVYAFGDASFYGSMGGTPLRAPIVGIAATLDGEGYWLAGADGGVYAFGDAHFYGAIAGTQLSGSIVGITATPDRGGYWLTGADGGVFAFGDAGYFGSHAGTPLPGAIVAMAATRSGNGYWLAGVDGSVYPYGDAVNLGDLSGLPPHSPVAAIASP